MNDEEAEKVGFMRGTICALSVLKSHFRHQGDVLFRDILNHAGADDVIQQARRDGSMQWSGLAYFVRYHKEDIR